jgi:serine/threonine protein kinase
MREVSAMLFMIRCPNPACGKTGGVREEFANQLVRCPSCWTNFTVEALDILAEDERGFDTPPNTVASDRPSSPTLAPGKDGGIQETFNDTPRQIGRFHIRSLLGHGRFGRVYRAYDPQHDREVALKVAQPMVAGDPRLLKRFLSEAKAAVRLHHPHIVPFYEVGSDGNYHFLVSAFIEGQTLAALLDEVPASFRQAAQVVQALAEALASAHDEGIVHRDVKPANVMIDQEGQPRLMDFGLARRQDGLTKLTRVGSLLGTPGYMAPEHARGYDGEPQPASDQYSLGVIFYVLLSGQTPFSGTQEILLFHTLNTKPPRLRKLKPQVPKELERICSRAMSKRPEDRYATCHEFAAAVRNWLVLQTASDVMELPPTPWLNFEAPNEVANWETQTSGEDRALINDIINRQMIDRLGILGVNPKQHSAPLKHQKRRFFRFASPTCLIGTLILFMLPWIEVSCTNYPGPGSTVIDVSGFDLALDDGLRPGIRIPMIIFGCFVIGGMVAGFAMMPSIRRAVVVGSTGLFCVLLPLSLTLTYKDYIIKECRFTLWYYLSYITSVGSVLLSVREAKIILSKQGAVSQTVPRWALCFLFGWSLLVVAWFLPVIAGSHGEGGPQAIEVAFVASYEGFLRWPPVADRTGFQKFLILLSLLSNVVTLASFVISATSSRRTFFIYASILAGSALLNTQWLFYGDLPPLGLGYYCWLASFIVLAGAAFLLARYQGDGSVSTRELFARAVPVFFLMNLGIFAVLGILWFLVK